jgi:hypothetical protein
VSDPDADRGALREAIAGEYGLGDQAAALLTGSTVAELEQSAAALARLLSRNLQAADRREEPTPGMGFFAAAAAARDARKRELTELFTGRTSPSRDERGRWAKPATGFDGGARREGLPVPKSPEQAHNELVAQASSRRPRGGARAHRPMGGPRGGD